jgi:hypothetical protein
MGATTIKVEGKLLDELTRAKPSNLSLSAFVRVILEREVLRQKLGDAAEQYARFLEKTPQEREWLSEWERTDLASPPKSRRRR